MCDCKQPPLLLRYKGEQVKHPLFKNGTTWVIQKSHIPGATCYAIWVEEELTAEEVRLITAILSNRGKESNGN